MRSICSMWAGLVLGGSLIAASVKFQVRSLPLSTALEIGRVTFRAVGMAELGLCILLCCLLVFGQTRWRWLYLLPVGIFAVQWLVLMPPLDARTLQRIQGNDVPGSNLHFAYLGLEVLKFLVLGGLGVWVRSSES